MNLNEIWFALTGKGGPFAKILKALDDLAKQHSEILEELDEIEAGNTPWQQDTTTRLTVIVAALGAIKDQLDRIEEDVGGGQAVSLAITVGTPEEQ